MSMMIFKVIMMMSIMIKTINSFSLNNHLYLNYKNNNINKLRFDIKFNKNYIESAINLLNLNNFLNDGTNNINKFILNDGKTLYYNMEMPISENNKNKNVFNILYKSKYEYLIHQILPFNDYKYYYITYINSIPCDDCNTIWEITINHNIDYLNKLMIKDIISSWLIKDIYSTSSLNINKDFKDLFDI